MKYLNSILIILLFGCVTTNAQRPEGVILNLKADAGIILNNDKVSEWQDIINPGIKAIPPDENTQPTFVQNAINGKPAVRFSGTQFLEASSVFPVFNDYSLFFVVSIASFNFTNCMIAGNGHAVYNNPPQVFHNDFNYRAISSKALSLNKPSIISVIYTESTKTAKMFIDGVLVAESIVGSNYDPIIYLGAYYKNYFLCGDIAEVLLYNRTLDNTEQKEVESYLFEKYLLERPNDGSEDNTFTSLPADNQLYPCDNDNSAKVNIAGNFYQMKFTKIAVKVFKNNMLIETLSQNLQFINGKAAFNLNYKIHAELSDYKFIISASNSNQDSVLRVRYNIVSGIVILVNGQSNSVVNNNPYTNKFIRTFGGNFSNSAADTLWCMADDWALGYGPNIGAWGMTLGQLVLENQMLPVCVINGGVSGTIIEQHLPSFGDKYNLNTIYGSMLYRVEKAKLEDAVKVLFWYQGESNNAADYQNNFISLTDSWLEDFPSLEKIYTVQIHTGCGGGYTHKELREIQRQIPDIIKKVEIETISSSGLPGHDGCHYEYIGYKTLGEQLYRLYNRDFFGSTDSIAISSPNISEAFFVNPNKDKLALVFKPELTVMNLQSDTVVGGVLASLKDYIYLDDNSKIISLSCVKDTIFIEFETGSSASSISYLPEIYYKNSQVIYEGPWLLNQRNMGALSFYKFPITDKQMVSITDHTNDLVNCSGTQGNFLFCNAETFTGNELHYEWFKDGKRLPDENSPILNFQKFDHLTSGVYKCSVYFSGGSSVFTTDIQVYALTKPEIIYQPKSIEDALIGETYNFDVKLRFYGELPLKYQDSVQWYKYIAKSRELKVLKDDERISGTNTPHLTISGLSFDDVCKQGDYYFVKIISQCGSIVSDPVAVSIIPKIKILSSLNDIDVCTGEDLDIKVDYEAVNCGDLSFNWYFNDSVIQSIANIEITNADLKLSNTNLNNSGKYYLEIESLLDELKVRSESMNISVNDIPKIISQSPETIVIDEGENFEIYVDVASANTVQYRWYKNSVLLPDYNNREILKNKSELTDAGIYYCEISNECGISKSNIVNLQINILNSVNNESGGKISIYPIPADDYLEMTFESGVESIMLDTKSFVSIFNPLGELLLTSLFEADTNHTLKFRIDVSSLVPGIYFLKIANRVEKFVKL